MALFEFDNLFGIHANHQVGNGFCYPAEPVWYSRGILGLGNDFLYRRFLLFAALLRATVRG